MPRNVWYAMGRWVIAIYARCLLDLSVAGRQHIPAGPKLIAANHPSTSDPMVLPLLFREPIDMLLIDSAFAIPLLGAYLRRAGQICVRRGDGSALTAARVRLEAGRSVAIFPEGNVSPRHGGTLPPRSGAARLALSTGVPVVPVGIALSRDRTRHIRVQLGRRALNGHWYVRGPYAMTAGRALRFDGSKDDAAHVASVTRTIMERIQALARDSERRLAG